MPSLCLMTSEVTSLGKPSYYQSLSPHVSTLPLGCQSNLCFLVKAVLILYYSHLIPVFTRLWASREGPRRSGECPTCACSVAQLLSHVWLCDAMDCSPPGSSVRGILQVRILEWVAMPFSRGSSQLKDQSQVSCTEGEFFTVWAPREALYHMWGALHR